MLDLAPLGESLTVTSADLQRKPLQAFFLEGSPNTQVELGTLSSRSHCSCPGTSVIHGTVIVCLGPRLLG